MSAGSHVVCVNASVRGEVSLVSSVTPPDFDNGPTGSTFHSISSLRHRPIADSGSVTPGGDWWEVVRSSGNAG